MNDIDPRTRMLLEAPPFPLLLRLASPNAAAFFVQAAVSMAEVWYIGRLGTIPLASIALVFPLLMLMQMMSGGALGGAVASSVARALGSGRRDRAERAAWHAIGIAIVGALSFLAAFVIGGEQFLRALGGEGEILDGAMAYCWVVFLGSPFIWLMGIVGAIYRGTGNMQFPASLMLLSAAIQVPLSGTLILGWFGVPALGILGAAVSVIVVSALISTIMIGRLVFGDVTVKLARHAFGFEREYFHDILKVALPASLSPVLTVLTIMSLTGLVSRFGPEALAGYGIGSRLEFLLVPLVFGIGAAMTSMVGINIGAGQIDRAERIGWLGASTAGVLAGSIGIVLAFMPELWVDLFADAPATVAAGVRYRYSGRSTCFRALGSPFTSPHRAREMSRGR